MSKKRSVFKKMIAFMGILCFLNGLIAEPGHAFFDWFLNFFSSAKASELTIALHEPGKSVSTPDAIQALKSLKKPVMLVLWSIGCQPCLQELVVLNKLAPQIRAQGAEIIPILLSSSWGQVVAFLTHMSRRNNTSEQPDRTWKDIFPNLPAYYDHQEQVRDFFKVTSVPLVVFLDEKGRPVSDDEGNIMHEGYKQWDLPEGLKILEENLHVTLTEKKPGSEEVTAPGA